MLSRAFWTSEFEFQDGSVRVKETGAVLPLNGELIREAFDWFAFYIFVLAFRLWNGVRLRRGPRLGFLPAAPRPWYLLWAVARVAGARFVPPEDADFVFYFEDKTVSAPVAPPGVEAARLVNFGCADVSKTRVGEAFEKVFGYPLAVDPSAWTGDAVEKSEANGAHDGRIVSCPRAPRPGWTYQRLIENSDDGAIVEDIRCPTMGGEIPVVFLKRRRVEDRFANENAEVVLARPEEVLSADERGALRRFAAEMELDWGGLDVLRDRRDGRIYVVDVNKTDMGPPTALPLAAKACAALRLARAFRATYSPSE